MNKRKLGNSGLAVAPLAFGGNVFGWTIDEKTSFRLLDAFVADGFNLIDTADVYAHWAPGNKGGESETIIGKWLQHRGQREKVLIATKVGGAFPGGEKDLSKAYIMKAAEASLRRLQTDVIDLYQSHWDDDTTPVDETMEAYAQLVKEGKVRALGASNLSPDRLQQSIDYSKRAGVPMYQALQPEYNLYARQKFEQEYKPLCEKEGLGVLNYFALASGFLTGKYRTKEDATKSTRGNDIVKTYLNSRGEQILKALDEVAARNNTNVATIALAWLLAQPFITAPIASATSVEQLAELTKAVELQLSNQDVQQLTEASAY